jgi:hypothetical protein
MIAKINTRLPISAECVWKALLKINTFLFITKGMLGFDGSEQWPEFFHEGLELETRLLFFHFLPGWKHSLRVVSINSDNLQVKSEESGGLVRTWNHGISVKKLSDNCCNYTDEIEIDAGIFTLLIWIYAQIFYRYRQKRWRRLVKRFGQEQALI